MLIVLAPMGGGPSTPELCAAVSEAGGLGFIAAGYRTAEQLAGDIGRVRELTRRPFGVNLFVPSRPRIDEHALGAWVERLRAAHGAEQVGEPRWDDDGWEAKLEVLERQQVRYVSFTFGPAEEAVVARLRAAGSRVWVTVTTPAEAVAAGDVDGLVLQGLEAGGHRGIWVDEPGAEQFGLLALIRLVRGVSDLPLVATGGIGDRVGVAAVLAAGASAAALGTAFMRAPEAGTHRAHRDALATDTPTALTRAFSGRLARGLRNRFLDEYSDGAPLAYPQLHHATSPLRAAARTAGDAGGFNLWAGQAHRLAEAKPAAVIVRELMP